MLVLALVIFCLIVTGADRLVVRQAARAARDMPAAPTPAGRPRRRSERPTAQPYAFPCCVQDRWTALDDRQVARLLDDSAPC